MESIKSKIESISSETLNGKNYFRSDFARNILNYPAMMVPSVQEPIIEKLSSALNNNVSMIDPFMGASNTLVTGMKYGINVFGQDINPLSLLLSQVKTCIYSPIQLIEAEQRIYSVMLNDSSESIEVSFLKIDKWFTKNIQIELSKIYRAILRETDLKTRKFFWVAIAETIRLTSNDRTSTFKMHMRSADEISSRHVSALKTFMAVVRKNIKSISEFMHILNVNGHLKNDTYIKAAEVVWGNTYSGINTDKTFNLLVTSPPYGDNQTTVTYGQFSYLQLQWIPMEDIDSNISIDYLKSTQSIDNVSLGGQSSINLKETEAKLFEKSKTLRNFIAQFKDEDRKKAEKVTRFINDLDTSIDKILPKMINDSYLVWTIGNRNVNKQIVQNDNILEELFSCKGISLFSNLERDISNKRMPGRNNFSNMMVKEKILIFKKTY